MLLTTEAYALIRKAIFRIPIEPAAEDDWWWGTGFFISRDGYALTAFHNLPANVIAQGKGELVGILRDGAKIPFRYIPSKGDERRDIAVLKARARRKGEYPYLPPAFLDAELSERERIIFWAGRAVIVAGFPFINERGQVEEVIPGHLRGDVPFGIEDEKDAGDVGVQIERLRIIPDKSKGLPGISGGPILDLASGCVVGGEGACDEDRPLILGSELLCDNPKWPVEVRRQFRRLTLTLLVDQRPLKIAPDNEESMAPNVVLDYMERQMMEWFDIVGYQFENHSLREQDYFQWIINVQNRRGFDRILVRGIEGMAERQHVIDLRQAVERLRTDEGWLVAFRRVSQAARDELEKQPRRNLYCYTFDELFDERADFTGYLEWLEQEIKEHHIDELYVDLACTKEEFDPVTKQKVGESRYDERNGWIDRYVGQWLADPAKEHISILGEFGMGKTWFTLHYAWVALRRYREAREQGIERPRLPLVIPLRDYARAGSVEALFSEFFFRKHKIPLPNYSAFEQLNRMGKLLLIFDGFDEMASRKDRQKMNDNFRELQRVVVPGAKVILTTRSEFFPTTGEELALLTPQFEMLQLEKFDEDQIRKVLSLRAKPATVERIMGDREMLALVRRPVMIEFILKALPDIDAGKPVDMSRVYLYAVQRVMDRDIKAERTFTSQADKLYFLCELSWEMLSTNRATLNYRQFPDCLRRLFGSEVIEEKDLDHWQFDLLTNTMLIRTGEGDYFPVHRSLLDFFVAYKFVAELGVLAPDFTELAKGQSYVDQALAPRDYGWAEYFHREMNDKGEVKRIPPLNSFVIEDSEKAEKDAVEVEKLTRNALAFAAQMVSTDPECLDRLCITSWERPSTYVAQSRPERDDAGLCISSQERPSIYGWNALNLLPFLKFQASEKLANILVKRSEGGAIRSGVAWVLGELGVRTDDVLEALRRTLRWFAEGKSVTPSAWWESAFALEKLSESGPRTGRRGDVASRFLIDSLPPGYDSLDTAVQRFITDLKTIHPSSINQSNIVGILAFEPEVDHQELFRAIQEHIDFSVDRIRRRCYYSVWLCGHLRIEESLDDVVKATKHAFGSVRNCASEALGKMGIRSASVISALEERLLEDQYYRARYHAAWSLGELKSTNSLAKLDAAIKDEEVLDVKQEMIRVRELLVR